MTKHDLKIEVLREDLLWCPDSLEEILGYNNRNGTTSNQSILLLWKQ